MTEGRAGDAEGTLRRPWRDEKLMRRMYEEEKLSTAQIAEKLDCAQSTVRNWLKRHGVKIRSISEGITIRHGNEFQVPLNTSMDHGHEVWWTSATDGGTTVYHHRLLAVSEYGLDAIRGKSVHHANEIPWDNRPENLELVSRRQHNNRHYKVPWLERMRIAEMYEDGEISSRDLAEHVDHDITFNTVLYIHKQFYGGEEGA